MTEVSDKRLIELWKDPHFDGSFRGIKAFQTLLKTDLNIDVSERRLHYLFKNEPFYLIHQRRKIVKRRSYDLHGLGELVQGIIHLFDSINFLKSVFFHSTPLLDTVL